MVNKSRIVGTGWAVPPKIRLNDDPIFDWVNQNIPEVDNQFQGYNVRHILDNPEDVIDIMVEAAQMALKNAGINANEIDILLGCGSVSPFMMPNILTLLHQKLNMASSCWVIPVTNDYSNFASSLVLAHGMITAGHAKKILICVGGNWSTNVDYHTTQSISAADGAGAAVVTNTNDTSCWTLKDRKTLTDTSYYGGMYTNGYAITPENPIQYQAQQTFNYQDAQGQMQTKTISYTENFPVVYSPQFFQILPLGGQGFVEFGEKQAMIPVLELLTKHGLTPGQISFMPHQTSIVIINQWLTYFPSPPAQVLDTIAQFANVTVATELLNFAYFVDNNAFTKDILVMLTLGVEMHANALMLVRNETDSFI